MNDYVTLPRTDLVVSRLCLGGNRLGGELDQDGSFALLDSFVEGGGLFIDTAHVYADWIPGNERSSSEKTLGRWLRARHPKNLVIATKGGHPDGDGAGRLDAPTLRGHVEDALRFLGVDTLDLFYVHRDDPQRPVADVLGSLERMRGEGLLRHYAASNWSAARLAEAAEVARSTGTPGFVANQPEWSFARRNAGAMADTLLVMDAPMIALHARLDLPAIPYSAQAKGYFDKASGVLDAGIAATYENPRNRALVRPLQAAADLHGVSPTQIMLAAFRHTPFLTIPIIGCRNPAQVRSSLDSLRIDLPADEAHALLAAAGCLPAA